MLFKTEMKPEILLRKTLHKTKNFFHKTFQKFKSFLFGGYQKLPKAPFVNPFFNASNSSQKMQELDNFYRGFSEQWDANHDILEKRKNMDKVSPKTQMVEDGECSQSYSNTTEKSSVENSQKERVKEESKELEDLEGKRDELCTDTANRGSHSLAQKMKEFEMLDVDDVDHLLDIEEILHCYSLLKCPVYLELVDKFFMDMYSEFLLPQPSVRVNSSMRRLGPVKL